MQLTHCGASGSAEDGRYPDLRLASAEFNVAKPALNTFVPLGTEA